MPKYFRCLATSKMSRIISQVFENITINNSQIIFCIIYKFHKSYFAIFIVGVHFVILRFLVFIYFVSSFIFIIVYSDFVYSFIIYWSLGRLKQRNPPRSSGWMMRARCSRLPEIEAKLIRQIRLTWLIRLIRRIRVVRSNDSN